MHNSETKAQPKWQLRDRTALIVSKRNDRSTLPTRSGAIGSGIRLRFSAGNMTNDQKFKLWLAALNGVFPLLKTTAKYGFSAYMLYCVWQMVEAVAGQETTANVIVRLIGELEIDRWVAYILAGVGIIYGLRQKHLRERSIERLTTYPEQLEKRLDPNRSSSNLTAKGKTRPEDKS